MKKVCNKFVLGKFNRANSGLKHAGDPPPKQRMLDAVCTSLLSCRLYDLFDVSFRAFRGLPVLSFYMLPNIPRLEGVLPFDVFKLWYSLQNTQSAHTTPSTPASIYKQSVFHILYCYALSIFIFLSGYKMGKYRC